MWTKRNEAGKGDNHVEVATSAILSSGAARRGILYDSLPAGAIYKPEVGDGFVFLTETHPE
jgi:hypothetical protein